MARSTGPILAVGAITIANMVIIHKEDMDWRVPIATGLTAGLFALGERAWPDGVVGLAWLALITSLFVRLRPNVPAPMESIADFWEGKR